METKYLITTIIKLGKKNMPIIIKLQKANNNN